MSIAPHICLISAEEIARVSRREYQDPPIHERTGARGVKEFYIRYRIKVLKIVDGKPVIGKAAKFYVIGPVTMGKRAAERAKADKMREVNGEIYTIQSHIPFEKFVEIWREEHYRSLKATSRHHYDTQIDLRILPAFTGRQLGSITALDIGRFIGGMESAGIARNTRLNARGILGKIFSDAKRWGYLKGDNPALGVDIGRTPGAVREQWTPTLEEAEQIIAKALPQTGLMAELVMWTGMRISEVLGLRCRNVDVDNATVLVVERPCMGEMDTPKSNAGRRELPVGHLIVKLAALVDGRSPEDHVFRGEDGGPLVSGTADKYLREAEIAAGHYHQGNLWHAFRRLHITMMSQKLSLFDLRAQAGHAQLSTTQRYVSTSIANRTRALGEMQGNVVPIRQ